jgi:hypothetical protein
VLGPLTLRVDIEHWPLAVPFRIAGYTFEVIDVVMVRLEKDGAIGRGEAAGVYYRQGNAASMRVQIEALGATAHRVGAYRQTDGAAVRKAVRENEQK